MTHSIEPRQRIMDAAQARFRERGIRPVTMDDLALDLGMSKKTLYKHFATKDILVRELIQAAVNAHHASTNERLKNPLPALEEMAEVLDYMHQNWTVSHARLFADLQKYHRNAWNIFSRYREDHIEQRIADIIARGQAEGIFRPEVDGALMARFHVLQVSLGFDTQAFPQAATQPGLLQTQLMEHFLFGMATAQGHAALSTLLARMAQQAVDAKANVVISQPQAKPAETNASGAAADASHENLSMQFAA